MSSGTPNFQLFDIAKYFSARNTGFQNVENQNVNVKKKDAVFENLSLS